MSLPDKHPLDRRGSDSTVSSLECEMIILPKCDHLSEKPVVKIVVDSISSNKSLDLINSCIPIGLVLKPIANSNYTILAFDTSPSHPRDPKMKSKGRKYGLTFLAASLVLQTSFASSAPTGGSSYIRTEFSNNPTLVLAIFLLGYCFGPFVSAPLSERFGRRPLFIYGGCLCTIFTSASIWAPNFATLIALRFLAGFSSTVPITNSAGMCGDLWATKEKGVAMAWYSVFTFCGTLGPIAGAFLSVHYGSWRSVFVMLSIFSIVMLGLTVIFLPETYPPTLLTGLAVDLRASTGNDRIVSRLEYDAILTRDVSRRDRMISGIDTLLSKPFRMLSEPIVLVISLYLSFIYGAIYLQFESYPYIFSSGIHHLPPGISSLPFIFTPIGALLSVPVSHYYQRKYLEAVAANGGISQPEMRLASAKVGGLLAMIGFLWLGWTGYRVDIHPVIPALSGIPSGIAYVCILRSLQTYFIDAFKDHSASAIAVNVVTRSIFGAVFPLFAKTMFQRLGVQWACTLLALIMLILVPVPFYFERYGARIRKNSRYAPS